MSMMTNTGKQDFTYNPNDRHMLVADRMQSGNYSFNYATAGAKIWTGILTFCCCRNYRIYGCGNASADSCQSGFYHGK